MGKKILLRHKEIGGLTFGPNNEIQFGPKAGMPDGLAEVDEDNPLLPQLMALEPVEVVRSDGGAIRTYICVDCDPELEFPTRSAYRAHRADVHATSEPSQDDDDGSGGTETPPAPKRPAAARSRRRNRTKRPAAKPAAPAEGIPAPAGDGN